MRNLCMEFTLLALKCVKLYEYEAFAGISLYMDPISIMFIMESELWEIYIPSLFGRAVSDYSSSYVHL